MDHNPANKAQGNDQATIKVGAIKNAHALSGTRKSKDGRARMAPIKD
jgi:hypothetical protein